MGRRARQVQRTRQTKPGQLRKLRQNRISRLTLRNIYPLLRSSCWVLARPLYRIASRLARRDYRPVAPQGNSLKAVWQETRDRVG